MRVLREDLKLGTIKLLPQNLDDLWHLFNLVEEGDLVRASTRRREERKTDKVRPERGEKKRVTLSLRVERRDYDEFTDRLRVHGVIEEGDVDPGAHHTLNVVAGSSLEIVKAWRESHLRRIREAVEATEKPLMTLVSLDDEEALVAQMHQSGIREVVEIRGRRSGKMYETEEPPKEEYYGQVLEKVRQLDPPGLIVLGPGFAREEFLQFGREREPELFAEASGFATGHPGITGIQEALRGGLAERVLEDSRVALETRFVERLLEEIARNGPHAYGPEEVETAVEAGAVETLLVTDELTRSGQVEDLMRRAEQKKGRVLVVSSRHDAGQKLSGLGGVGALLRFPLR
ncbi:MAG: mRNA surveillance protein pelota [Thermoplasmata archaeon]